MFSRVVNMGKLSGFMGIIWYCSDYCRAFCPERLLPRRRLLLINRKYMHEPLPALSGVLVVVLVVLIKLPLFSSNLSTPKNRNLPFFCPCCWRHLVSFLFFLHSHLVLKIIENVFSSHASDESVKEVPGEEEGD